MSDETPVMAPPPPPPPPAATDEVDGTSKLLAVLGYLFFIVAVIALVLDPYKSQHFSKAHAVQAIALNIVIWLLAWIPVIGWVLALVAFVFVVIAILKAVKGEIYEMPVVYGLVKSFVEG